MNKERIAYFDTMKAVSILLVVFCHFVLLPMDSIMGNIFMTLAYAAVPCFMMVSGSLMHQATSFSWKKYFYKVVKTYVVLIIWRIIYLVIYRIFLDISISSSDCLQYIFVLKDIDTIETGVMWYMIAYMIIQLLYPITYFLISQGGKKGEQLLVFILALCAIDGMVIPSVDWLLGCAQKYFSTGSLGISGLYRIMPFTNYANMIFYFILGALLFKYRDAINEKFTLKKYISVGFILLGVVGLLLIKYVNTNSFAWNNIYIAGGYNKVMTIFMSVGFYLFFATFKSKKVFQVLGRLLGKYTLGIYYMHYVLLSVLSIKLYPSLLEYSSFSLNCLKTIIVSIICAAITYIVRKIPIIRELVK